MMFMLLAWRNRKYDGYNQVKYVMIQHEFLNLYPMAALVGMYSPLANFVATPPVPSKGEMMVVCLLECKQKYTNRQTENESAKLMKPVCI